MKKKEEKDYHGKQKYIFKYKNKNKERKLKNNKKKSTNILLIKISTIVSNKLVLYILFY